MFVELHPISYALREKVRNVTIRYSAYDFLFDFNGKKLSASILYRFRNMVSYLSKVADFDPPHLH